MISIIHSVYTFKHPIRMVDERCSIFAWRAWPGLRLTRLTVNGRLVAFVPRCLAWRCTCASQRHWCEAQQAPTPLPSAAEEVGDSEPSIPENVAHWQRHDPWNFVMPMALNSRGEQIYYRVESDQDRILFACGRGGWTGPSTTKWPYASVTWANCQTATRGT
jgi:hypothetical protein